MMRVIENCASSAESAANAQAGGAFRVELCAGIPEGGTTPSYGEIVTARRLLTTTRLHVIIRPRGGDFLYSPIEEEIMSRDIDMAREAGADGVVIGCLTASGDIDTPMARRLLAHRGDMSVTFHRAFDMCRDPFTALEQIIDLGIDRILTSGQEATAEKGIPLIRQLIDRAAGRIVIMPGCGVNASNIGKIESETGATEFHMSARSRIASGMTYRNPRVSMGGTVHIDEYSREITDAKKIGAAAFTTQMQ